MISRSQKEELDNLEYRYLQTRSRAAKRPAPPKEVIPQKTEVTVEPEIHVHIDMPEAKEAPKVEPAKCAPRKWVFKHKYDVYNKLVETTATCE